MPLRHVVTDLALPSGCWHRHGRCCKRKPQAVLNCSFELNSSSALAGEVRTPLFFSDSPTSEKRPVCHANTRQTCLCYLLLARCTRVAKPFICRGGTTVSVAAINGTVGTGTLD